MEITKNVDFNEIYKFCLEHSLNFCIFTKITAKTMIFVGFYGFHHDNFICANFQYDFRNQRIKIRKCSVASTKSEVSTFLNLIPQVLSTSWSSGLLRGIRSFVFRRTLRRAMENVWKIV